MKNRNLSLPIAITFMWLGCVCAISFLEAPVKFTAPHLTLQVGVEVGRQVFKALNKAEIVFCAIILCFTFINQWSRSIRIISSTIALIVLLQSVWLLPALHLRVDQIINGATPPPSNLHYLYILLDVLKVVGLVLLGINQFNYYKEKCLQDYFISK
ncbi:DUF4149 domain-containing protein [Solitalea lacus]|uniref:DUF4149 domain-containing protein n=1 Tax=Solitalea lacus TaxID=2911172 RepID=UPI001EDA8C76|nr:DUF4149 domain-containing protein [Solitalea lacus]UKJ06842.1 DUF4149 domain-containing protein [Solitalea lacus]